MKNLATIFKDKTLEELVIKDTKVQVEPLEPTLAEKKAILAALVEGKSYKEIKKEVRRFEMEGEVQKSAKGFSYGQIALIDKARKDKITELRLKEPAPTLTEI